MEKIWERDDFWDKITGTTSLARYANPFRIINSDGNTLMSKSNIHHLKAKFEEYIFDNKDNVKYPFLNDRQGGARGFIVNRV